MIKILKNTTASPIELKVLGVTIPANDEYNIHVTEFLKWAELECVTELTSYINSGDIVVNDGKQDLIGVIGLVHVGEVNGVVRNHSDITLLPAVTVNAPGIVRISGAGIGFQMQIDDEIFGQTRLNNYAGNGVEVQLHMAIDNAVADRWIQFDVHFITTNGINDKPMNIINGTLQMLQEVPTTPWRVFESVVEIPASYFENGEKYIYIGIERVTAIGKTAPINHPNVLRYCKRYWEVLES